MIREIVQRLHDKAHEILDAAHARLDAEIAATRKQEDERRRRAPITMTVDIPLHIRQRVIAAYGMASCLGAYEGERAALEKIISDWIVEGIAELARQEIAKAEASRVAREEQRAMLKELFEAAHQPAADWSKDPEGAVNDAVDAVYRFQPEEGSKLATYLEAFRALDLRAARAAAKRWLAGIAIEDTIASLQAKIRPQESVAPSADAPAAEG